MTMPNHREYAGADYDLAIGEVYGLRVWRVDQYGRLRARHIAAAPPWRPGINEAQCFADAYWKNGVNAMTLTLANFTAGISHSVVAERPETPPPHACPDERCGCGWYAYSQPCDETVMAQRNVLGIIKGTGRTLIGTKGFRCQRAEILALLDPASDDDDWGRWQSERLRALYPDVPLLATRVELTRFAPLTAVVEPGSDEFWSQS